MVVPFVYFMCLLWRHCGLTSTIYIYIYFCFIQEVCQAVQQLNPRLMALSSAMKRLGECSQLEEEVANLKKQQQEFMGKATEKQSTLESLLALWQR